MDTNVLIKTVVAEVLSLKLVKLTQKTHRKKKKEIETSGGYLKTLEYKEAWRLAWNKASKGEHEQLLKLPNWDNGVFKEITGIDAAAEIAKE